MNTERRHELQNNALVHGITNWSERLRPYTSAMLGIVALLLGVFIVGSMWNSYQRSRDQAAWDDYEMAIFESNSEAASLQRLANSEDHEGTKMQEWAFMSWADRQLLQASFQYLQDRTAAKERLSRVASIYGQIAEHGSSSELKNRARLGLARVNEMEGDLDEAKTQYALVDGALAAIAEERAKQLESKPTAETIAWLATVELPKRTPPGGPGTPGERPGFEAVPPTPDAKSGLNFDSTQSLEEIIGGIQAAEGAKRYEDDAKTDGDAASDEAEQPAPMEDAAAEESAPPAAETAEAETAEAETVEAEAADAEASESEPAPSESAAPAEEAPAEDETPAPATSDSEPAAP